VLVLVLMYGRKMPHVRLYVSVVVSVVVSAWYCRYCQGQRKARQGKVKAGRYGQPKWASAMEGKHKGRRDGERDGQ
jgi:hypothetical protein